MARLTQPINILRDVKDKLLTLIEQVNATLGVEATRLDPEFRFRDQFEVAKGLTTKNLRLLREEATQSKKIQDTAFLSELETVSKRAVERISIPSVDEIEERILKLPNGEEATVIDNALLQLRSQLADNFGRMRHDLGIKHIEVWQKRLWASLEPMHIDRFVDANDPQEGFTKLWKKLEATGVAPRLCESFRMIADFKIHFPHFLASVWHALDFSSTDAVVKIVAGPTKKTENTNQVGAEIPSAPQNRSVRTGVRRDLCQTAVASLTEWKSKLIKDIKKELTKIATLPAELSWGLVCDTYDRIYVSDGIWREWETMLRLHRSEFVGVANWQHESLQRRLINVVSQSQTRMQQLTSLIFLAS
jgi:hypothetical protein